MDLDRIAAKQRRIRDVMSREAGILIHLEGMALKAGLEQPSIDAIRMAHAVLTSRVTPKPFVPENKNVSEA